MRRGMGSFKNLKRQSVYCLSPVVHCIENAHHSSHLTGKGLEHDTCWIFLFFAQTEQCVRNVHLQPF